MEEIIEKKIVIETAEEPVRENPLNWGLLDIVGKCSVKPLNKDQVSIVEEKERG